MTDAERSAIVLGFLRPCAELLMTSRDKGNWQVWHNGGIMALGVALKNDSIIRVALEKPVLGYYDMMKYHVYDDGWWNEGSVVYHFYPLRAILLSAEAVRCRGIDLYDSKMVNMFLSPVQLLYPDMMFPSQNDGWYGTTLFGQLGLYEIVALRTGHPTLKQILAACYGRDSVKRNFPEALINGMKLDGAQSADSFVSLSSHLFPDLGVGVLRYQDKTVVLKDGPSGGLHGHPDKLSISIHDGRREILPDLGTTAYGVPDCYAWYRRTISHNTVTVDGRDQQPTKGTIVRFEVTPTGGSMEAMTDSAYIGVNMRRSLTLDKRCLTDRFVCRSDSEHVYDYVLILRDPVDIPAMQNDTLPEYERISAVRKAEGRSALSLSMADGTRLTLKADAPFECFTGVAPGIPPTGLKPGADVYPLVIRTKGKDLDIEAIWNLAD